MTEGSKRPAFTAPLYAAVRQGAKELAQILPAFPDGIQPVEEPGTLANPTPQMVTQEIGTVQGYDQLVDRCAERGSPREPERDLER